MGTPPPPFFSSSSSLFFFFFFNLATGWQNVFLLLWLLKCDPLIETNGGWGEPINSWFALYRMPCLKKCSRLPHDWGMISVWLIGSKPLFGVKMSLLPFILDPIYVRDLDHEIKDDGRAIFTTGCESPSYFCPFPFINAIFQSHERRLRRNINAQSCHFAGSRGSFLNWFGFTSLSWPYK